MDFKDRLIERYGFTERDWNETVSRYRPETLQARSLFLEKGQTATRIAYLRSGMMRSFFYDDRANEITTHFFKKGSDRFSYPAEGGDVDAEVGCDMFQGDFLQDVRVFFDEELVPFRCCEGL